MPESRQLKSQMSEEEKMRVLSWYHRKEKDAGSCPVLVVEDLSCLILPKLQPSRWLDYQRADRIDGCLRRWESHLEGQTDLLENLSWNAGCCGKPFWSLRCVYVCLCSLAMIDCFLQAWEGSWLCVKFIKAAIREKIEVCFKLLTPPWNLIQTKRKVQLGGSLWNWGGWGPVLEWKS